MGMRTGRWRLLGMAVVVAVLASAGLLMAAERGARTTPRTAAGPASPPKAQPLPPAVAPKQPAGAAEVEIASPEQGATLRGTALLKVDYLNPMGYVVFRVDDRFAYATTPPFEMRWDTTSALDGQHVISVDAYDGSARYAGSASISVLVENSIPTPPDGVLLTVRFDEHDLLARAITARGELSALRADEALPPEFEQLAGELRAEVTTSVMDAFYEGATALVRSRLRTGALTSGGQRTSLPEVGQQEMLQISRNGLAVPVATAIAKPRLGLAEISLALRDFPVVPGDAWESPIGVVCDLYSRRGVFVMGRHVFEGLRWYRGKECAVVSSTYAIPALPIYTQQQTQQPAVPASAAGAAGPSYRIELTQRALGAMGGRAGRGPARGGAGRAGRARAGAATARAGRAGAAGQRAGAAQQLQSAQLVDLEGSRLTYITRQTGRVLHTEDTVLGQIEFRVASQQAARNPGGRLVVELTGAGGMRGGRGMTMRGAARAGVGARAGAQRATAGRAGAAAGAAGAKRIPPRLDYGVRLTTDLIVE
jgi:hypothetical protein